FSQTEYSVRAKPGQCLIDKSELCARLRPGAHGRSNGDVIVNSGRPWGATGRKQANVLNDGCDACPLTFSSSSKLIKREQSNCRKKKEGDEPSLRAELSNHRFHIPNSVR